MRQPPPQDREIREVYIDESSQTGHRYLVLGAITLMRLQTSPFTEEIKRRRLPELPKNEMKWNKVSNAKLSAYKRVVQAFFDAGDRVHFHSLFVDTTKLKHHLYNQGNRDIGFSKEIYQIVMKCGRLYPDLFHVYPDHRTTKQTTEELRLILNRGIKKEHDKRDWPFRRLQFRDSKSTELLQMADIFAGAIAYRLNGHDKQPGASEARIDLCNHILGAARIRDPLAGTARRGKFTIWNRILR